VAVPTRLPHNASLTKRNEDGFESFTPGARQADDVAFIRSFPPVHQLPIRNSPRLFSLVRFQRGAILSALVEIESRPSSTTSKDEIGVADDRPHANLLPPSLRCRAGWRWRALESATGMLRRFGG